MSSRDHGSGDNIEELGPSTASPHADNACAESIGDEKVPPALDAFGDETGAEVKYKTMHWWQASMVMVAENISLGILSLPAVFSTNGLVAGVLALIGIGLFCTYGGYVLWQFRMRHPEVASYTDIGQVLFGRIGREVFGAAFVIVGIFVMASHLLTWTIALNTLSNHGTCTIAFGAVGIVVFALLTIPRTLKKVSFLAIISFMSIMSAVLITIIALAVSPRASYATMSATLHPSLPTGFNSISNVVFAYAGHLAWVSFISELRDPREFPKALLVQQAFMIIAYLVVSIVVYYYGGDNVASPALSSTSKTVAKVAWGVALPTIIIAGVIFAHVMAKYIFLRLFRDTPHLHSRGIVATGTWIGIGATAWTLAWIISQSIPIFSDLLGFISALFGSWFGFIIPGYVWFVLNRGTWFGGGGNIALAFVNVAQMIIGFVVFGLGLYSSGTSMAASSAGKVWSCADNSN
ncbi:transmembrane amino acid transporter protein-domain-containing protein [Diaporthe sp. PMI_573]|nr:transmembrane amino acid transporter protein-domain-containing protein [Diaporthaceae sp. PMI_573]